MNAMRRMIPIVLTGLLLAGCSSGCKNLQVAEGHDAAVVRSEQTAKIAISTVDAFLAYETENRGAVPAQVTASADVLRDTFPPAYETFRSATKAYKKNRSQENKATLATASKVIESLMASALKHLPSALASAAKAKADKMEDVPELSPAH